MSKNVYPPRRRGRPLIFANGNGERENSARGTEIMAHGETRVHVSTLGNGMQIRFEFPNFASMDEIELVKEILALQISTWRRWNEERIADEKFHTEFTRWQNDGGR
jgi:hypothetical protein